MGQAVAFGEPCHEGKMAKDDPKVEGKRQSAS